VECEVRSVKGGCEECSVKSEEKVRLALAGARRMQVL